MTSVARPLARLQVRLPEVSAVLAWPSDRLYLRWEPVSAWSPAQHVDHAIRTLDLVFGRIEALRRGEAAGAESGPTLRGRLVLWSGWIPRGRAAAPAPVRPDARPVRHRLREALAEVERNLDEALGALRRGPAPVGSLPHPLLGPFDAAGWARFAEVHTRHHLRILHDVDRHRGVGVPGPEEGRPCVDGDLCSGAGSP